MQKLKESREVLGLNFDITLEEVETMMEIGVINPMNKLMVETAKKLVASYHTAKDLMFNVQDEAVRFTIDLAQMMYEPVQITMVPFFGENERDKLIWLTASAMIKETGKKIVSSEKLHVDRPVELREADGSFREADFTYLLDISVREIGYLVDRLKIHFRYSRRPVNENWLDDSNPKTEEFKLDPEQMDVLLELGIMEETEKIAVAFATKLRTTIPEIHGTMYYKVDNHFIVIQKFYENDRKLGEIQTSAIDGKLESFVYRGEKAGALSRLAGYTPGKATWNQVNSSAALRFKSYVDKLRDESIRPTVESLLDKSNIPQLETVVDLGIIEDSLPARMEQWVKENPETCSDFEWDNGEHDQSFKNFVTFISTEVKCPPTLTLRIRVSRDQFGDAEGWLGDDYGVVNLVWQHENDYMLKISANYLCEEDTQSQMMVWNYLYVVRTVDEVIDAIENFNLGPYADGSKFRNHYSNPIKDVNESVITPEQQSNIETMLELGIVDNNLGDKLAQLCLMDSRNWMGAKHSDMSGDSVIVSDSIVKPVEVHPDYEGYVKIGDTSYIIVRDTVAYICMNYVCENMLLDDDMPANGFGPGNSAFYSRYRDWIHGVKWQWFHDCNDLEDIAVMIEQFNQGPDCSDGGPFKKFGNLTESINEAESHSNAMPKADIESLIEMEILNPIGTFVIDLLEEYKKKHTWFEEPEFRMEGEDTAGSMIGTHPNGTTLSVYATSQHSNKRSLAGMKVGTSDSSGQFASAWVDLSWVMERFHKEGTFNRNVMRWELPPVMDEYDQWMKKLINGNVNEDHVPPEESITSLSEVRIMYELGMLDERDRICLMIAEMVISKNSDPDEEAYFEKSDLYGLVGLIPIVESSEKYLMRILYVGRSVNMAIVESANTEKEICEFYVNLGFSDHEMFDDRRIMEQASRALVDLLSTAGSERNPVNESIDKESIMQQMDTLLDLGIVEENFLEEVQQLPSINSGIKRVLYHDGFGVLNVVCDLETLPVPGTHPEDDRFKLIGSAAKLVRQDDGHSYVFAQYVTPESTSEPIPDDAFTDVGQKFYGKYRDSVMGFSWIWNRPTMSVEDVLDMINEYSDEFTRANTFKQRSPGGRTTTRIDEANSIEANLPELKILHELGIIGYDPEIMSKLFEVIKTKFAKTGSDFELKYIEAEEAMDISFRIQSNKSLNIGFTGSLNVSMTQVNDWFYCLISKVGPNHGNWKTGDFDFYFNVGEDGIPKVLAKLDELLSNMIKKYTPGSINESDEYDVMAELGLFDPVQTAAIKTGNMMIENFPNDLTNLRFDLDSSIKICRATADFVNHRGWSITASIINYDDDESARVVLRVADMFGSERASSRSLLAPDDTDLNRRDENKQILSALKEIMEKVRLLHVKPIYENLEQSLSKVTDSISNIASVNDEVETMIGLGIMDHNRSAEYLESAYHTHKANIRQYLRDAKIKTIEQIMSDQTARTIFPGGLVEAWESEKLAQLIQAGWENRTTFKKFLNGTISLGWPGNRWIVSMYYPTCTIRTEETSLDSSHFVQQPKEILKLRYAMPTGFYEEAMTFIAEQVKPNQGNAGYETVKRIAQVGKAVDASASWLPKVKQSLALLSMPENLIEQYMTTTAFTDLAGRGAKSVIDRGFRKVCSFAKAGELAVLYYDYSKCFTPDIERWVVENNITIRQIDANIGQYTMYWHTGELTGAALNLAVDLPESSFQSTNLNIDPMVVDGISVRSMMLHSNLRSSGTGWITVGDYCMMSADMPTGDVLNVKMNGGRLSISKNFSGTFNVKHSTDIKLSISGQFNANNNVTFNGKTMQSMLDSGELQVDQNSTHANIQTGYWVRVNPNQVNENVNPGTLEQLQTMVDLGMVDDDLTSQFIALPDVDPTFLKYDASGNHPLLIVTDETLTPPRALRGLGDAFHLMGKTYKLSLFPGKNPGSNRTTYALQIDAFYSTDAFDAKFGADMPYVVFGNSAWSWKAKHLGPRSKQNKGIVQVTWDTPDDVEITSMFEVLEFIDAFNADHTNLRCSIHEELKESINISIKDQEEMITLADLGIINHVVKSMVLFCDELGKIVPISSCEYKEYPHEHYVAEIKFTIKEIEYTVFVHVLNANVNQLSFSIWTGNPRNFDDGKELGSRLFFVFDNPAAVIPDMMVQFKALTNHAFQINESFKVDPAKMEEVKTLAELGIERDTLYARMNAMHDAYPAVWLSVTSSGDGESFVGVTVHDTQTNTPKKLTEYTGYRGEGMDSKLGNTTKLMMSRRYDSPNPMLTQKVPIYDLDVLAFYGREHDAEMMADDDCFENGLPVEDHNVTVRWRYKRMLHGLEDLEQVVSDFRDSNVRTTEFSRTVS